MYNEHSDVSILLQNQIEHYFIILTPTNPSFVSWKIKVDFLRKLNV